MPRMALVVPSIHKGGGVRAVARFIWETARRSGAWDVKPISLCMASDDPESTSIRSPRTWLAEPDVGTREWMGEQICHVGARFGDIEFQRYRPRRVLARLITDCDIVQVVSGSPAWANTVVGLGKPVSLQVATLAKVERRTRSRLGRGSLAMWRRAMTRIVHGMDERALQAVDAIQLENPWMFEHTIRLNRWRSGVDIRYAPPGVDVDEFRPLRARDPSRGYILCVARLGDVRKNLMLLLSAYEQLPEDFRSRYRLVLAGAGPMSEDVRQRALSVGAGGMVDVVQNPDRTTLLELYQNASVFCLPSDEEGLGVVVLEAMACGVPTVCTRSGGPDGIITDGVDGRLVPCGNVHALRDALREVLEDPSANIEMGRAARGTIEQRYSLEVAGAAYIDIWSKLLKVAGGGASG